MGSAADLIRAVRVHRRLSQAQLAIRAGTTQTAISRLERGQRSPSVQTLRRLLLVMGEDLALESRPLEGTHDPDHLRAERKLSPAQRLTRALDWMRLNAQVRQARTGVHR
jgi:transcriptional regulator with XRE-family HTH domain